ncbi:gamma-glutamyltransferase [Mycobacterium sp. AMU20-3851]|uniref:gamma-glutamyltransferase n=1 Tax=Mycobacterium sp. AMU20-3851 TaxID=3122055 RepID=UPI003753F2DA
MIGPVRGGNLIARRCSAAGRLGVVGTSAPEAAWIGRDMLRAGGNAYDAALAAALAETVLVPSKCGLAGDLIALTRTPDGEVRCLVAIGGAAAGLADAVAEQGLPVTGGLATGVPGAPAGYQELASLATLALPELAAPAIGLARNGAAWSPLTYDYTVRAAATLRRENPEGVVFLPKDQPIPAGKWTALPGHADALTEFARVGAELFHGVLGDAMVSKVADRGGVITIDDLKSAYAQWVPPATAMIGGRQLWATPLPTHGPALFDALMGSGPVADQATRVRDARDRLRASAGDQVGDSGTSVVTAADGAGNVVVLVHSLSHPTFGSGLVLPGVDLVLGNRPGRGFTDEAGHPNAPAPGRRPVTTLHAWAIGGTDAMPFTAGATSGGIQQVPWNLQVIERLTSSTCIEHAVLEPIWEISGDGVVRYEDEPWSMESGIQIVQPPDEAGVCHVVSDIRSIGGTAAA